MRFSSKSKGLGFYLQTVFSLSASMAPSPGTVWEKKAFPVSSEAGFVSWSGPGAAEGFGTVTQAQLPITST